MSDPYQPGQEGGGAPVEPAVRVGAELRAARERAGLSVIDVAQRLKFAARQIEALEADNIDALPGLTFVRGFVRSYAKMLGLDADHLVAALEGTVVRDIGPNTVQLQSLTASAHKPFPMRQGNAGSAWPWVIGIVVAVVGIGGYILYQWQAPLGLSQPAASSAPAASPNITPVANDAAASGAASSGAEVSAVSPGAATAGANVALAATPSLSVAPSAPAKAEEAGKGKIHLVFSEEAWTEVRGAGGQILYAKNNLAGSDVWLDGTPPFDFVIGNAKGVKLYYRGSEVDLTPYVKVTVARMQLK